LIAFTDQFAVLVAQLGEEQAAQPKNTKGVPAPVSALLDAVTVDIADGLHQASSEPGQPSTSGPARH
jgi:hypothetical protein